MNSGSDRHRFFEIYLNRIYLWLMLFIRQLVRHYVLLSKISNLSKANLAIAIFA
jgi:hypothetical protein